MCKALTGAFKLADTLGIPLELILLECRDHNFVIAWDVFIEDARKHGWTDKTIRKKILGAINEVYNAEYITEFISRLDLALSTQR